ncbi:hypothetical protein PVAP13_2NG287000 [Panicum virgatum]|uniref:Uncharacterized protein n=1 Tax=Panicum virgatum TaxID=38727 RepID=A0A8T0VN22_PANVG|nr:hypothetical protein PVAP13_2NG287000 [Panicum virgatum]
MKLRFCPWPLYQKETGRTGPPLTLGSALHCSTRLARRGRRPAACSRRRKQPDARSLLDSSPHKGASDRGVPPPAHSPGGALPWRPAGEISLVLSPAPVGSKPPEPRSLDHHHHHHRQAAMEELAGSRRLQQEHHHLQHQPFPAAGAEPAADGMTKDVKPLCGWLTSAPLFLLL